MSDEIHRPNQQSVRGTDSNSLLRLYDQATLIVAKSLSQQERVRAGKTAQRIADELRKRSIVAGGQGAAAVLNRTETKDGV
jgi:hypothetical protein